MTFGAVLARLDDGLIWNHSVYLSDPHNLTLETMCLVIDSDAAEHGEDNYTPLIAEQSGLEEFPLVQDIMMVRDYVAGCGVDPNERSLTFATKFYFERDAYPGEAELAQHS